MNWKELFGGVVATALLVLFSLWTTDFEIGSKGGYALAVGIIFVMSVAWRIVLHRFFKTKGSLVSQWSCYAVGALVASVLALILI
jgi:hypothetical protein